MLYTQKMLNINFKDLMGQENLSFQIEKFKDDLKNVPEYEALNIAYREDDLDKIELFVENLKKNFSNLLVLGIGGSSLGAKTLLSVKNNHNVEFLENIDSEIVEEAFSKLDFKNTAILTISKSGKTIECISQTLLLMNLYKNAIGNESIKEHFFFLTENKDSPLVNLANHFKIQTIEHNKNIGGRFSYLSNVGLIPACFAGLDAKKIRRGAKKVIEDFYEDDYLIKSIICGQNILYKNGIVANVLMTYQERLRYLQDWYRQLWAESLGKDNFGTIPVVSVGTIDQHSQLQLYLGGRKNLFFTFFIKKQHQNTLKINDVFIKDFSYLKNKTLDDIMEVESKSTIEILNKEKLPIRIFEYETLDEEVISQFMMQFVLETIFIGKLNNINPFGQPNVEKKKQLAMSFYNDWKNNG